jgi:hypothetical protein
LSTGARLAGATEGGGPGTAEGGAGRSDVFAEAEATGDFGEAGPATAQIGRLAGELRGNSVSGGTTGSVDGAGSERWDTGAGAKAGGASRVDATAFTAIDDAGATPRVEGRSPRVATMATRATVAPATRGHARRSGREGFDAGGDSTAIGSVSLRSP